jgi:hypothetical protein
MIDRGLLGADFWHWLARAVCFNIGLFRLNHDPHRGSFFFRAALHFSTECSMKFVARIGGAALSVGLLLVWAALLSGCDVSNETTTTKPIESNILKKLGQSSPSQGQLESAKDREKAGREKKLWPEKPQ